MQSRKVVSILVLLLFLAPPVVACAEEEVNAIIEKVVDAYGGRGPLTSIDAYRLEASMNAVNRGEQAEITRIVKGVDYFALMLRYPSQTEVRVFKEGQAWRGSDPDKLEIAQGPAGAAIVLQSARINIVKLLDTMRQRVRQDSSSQKTIVLELRLGANLWVRAMIDRETHHVLATQSLMRIGEQSMQFETQYSDFRKVDGVLFAFHEENYAGGMHMGSINVKKIETNPAPERLILPSNKGSTL